MRMLFTFLVPMAIGILLTASVFAQSPEKMSYQAVIRNASNNLVTSTAVAIKISILQDSTSGTAVYVETQTPTTNANGLVSIEIGGGTLVSGNFSTINWANGPYFIKTETDLNGGTNYTITGTNQLLSVPYALHAKTAETLTGGITETDPVFIASPAYGINSGDIINWNNKLDTEVDGSVSNEIQNLTTNGDTIFISNGNYIILLGLSYLSSLIPKSVQQQLGHGKTPFEIYNSDNTLLDSLYGKTYQGGLIAFLDTIEGGGLIVAVNNQSDGAEWSCYGTLTGATSITFGNGAANTSLIVNNGCAAINSAAKICSDLSLNGYSDWYLPNKEELNIIFVNKTANMNFLDSPQYWTSTENDAFTASVQYMGTGNMFDNNNKGGSYLVRAVRNF